MVWSSRKPRQRWAAKYVVWVMIVLVTTPLVLNEIVEAAGRKRKAQRGDAVTVTATHVVTVRDRVPRACARPTVVAKRSGDWSQAATWSSGVPGEEAQVLIPRGTTVTYNLTQGARLRCVEVQGQLRFGNRNAVLYVSDLQVLPSGRLVIGTSSQPIDPDYRVEIVIRNTALQPGSRRQPGRDPEQYLTGLFVWGTLTIHGAPMPRTFIRLAREVQAGEQALELRHPPRGWRVGDEIVIPDTRQVDPARSSYQPQWETHTIEAIRDTTLTLSKLTTYHHPGARDAGQGWVPTVLRDGTWLQPHVGNLSRNVIIRSENAAGTRGHAFFAARARIDIRYAKWQNLGRTRAEPLDSSSDDAAGGLAHIGTNQAGRHALYFRHTMGPRRKHNRGYQFAAVGNVIEGGLKWGLALHDAHFGLVRDNVIFHVEGAGIATVSGNEFGNMIQRNFVTGIRGGWNQSGRFNKNGASKTDFGELGDAYWFAGPLNAVIDNVAASAVRTGFVVFPLNLSKKQRRAVRVPKFRGADMTRSSQTANVNISARSLRAWLRNEVYGATTAAITLWQIGQRQTFPDAEVTILKDQRVWHVPGVGLRFYQSQEYELDGWVQRSDPALVKPNPHGRGGGRGDGSLVTFGGAKAQRVYLRNFDGQGGQYGVLNRGRGRAEWLVVEGSPKVPAVLRNYINLAIRPWVQQPTNGRRTTILRNVMLEPLDFVGSSWTRPYPKTNKDRPMQPLQHNRRGLGLLRPLRNYPRGRKKDSPFALNRMSDGRFKPYHVAMQWQGHVRRQNVFRHEQTFIQNYQNRRGENYQLFYAEQAPGFVIPDVNKRGEYDFPQCIGLTNAECLRQHGGAIAGEVAPCLAHRDPDCSQAQALARQLGVQGLAFRLHTPVPQPPRPDAVLKVAQPIDGQVFESDTVHVDYYAGGDKDRMRYVYLKLDNEPAVYPQAVDGRYTFSKLKPGLHQLRIWAAREDRTLVEGTAHRLVFYVEKTQNVAETPSARTRWRGQ